MNVLLIMVNLFFLSLILQCFRNVLSSCLLHFKIGFVDNDGGSTKNIERGGVEKEQSEEKRWEEQNKRRGLARSWCDLYFL